MASYDYDLVKHSCCMVYILPAAAWVKSGATLALLAMDMPWSNRCAFDAAAHPRPVWTARLNLGWDTMIASDCKTGRLLMSSLFLQKQKKQLNHLPLRRFMGTESKKSTAQFTMCKFLLDGFCPYRASMGSVFHLGESSRSLMCTELRGPPLGRGDVHIWGFQFNLWGYPQWLVYHGTSPQKMDDLEVITPISGKLHFNNFESQQHRFIIFLRRSASNIFFSTCVVDPGGLSRADLGHFFDSSIHLWVPKKNLTQFPLSSHMYQ